MWVVKARAHQQAASSVSSCGSLERPAATTSTWVRGPGTTREQPIEGGSHLVLQLLEEGLGGGIDLGKGAGMRVVRMSGAVAGLAAGTAGCTGDLRASGPGTGCPGCAVKQDGVGAACCCTNACSRMREVGTGVTCIKGVPWAD